MANRVLVIEDDAGIRANILELLEAEGFEGEGAVDGEAGVEAALARPPALIVCDVQMPRLDGFGVLERLRKTPELGGVPFVFLSARSERRDVRAGMVSGADDYLTKPFSPAELLEVIRTRLTRQQAVVRQVELRSDRPDSRALDVSPSRPRELLVIEEEPATTPRYLIETLIGEGGMGVVYRAVDRKLQRKVALKVLHREVASSYEGPERLLREARAAAKLEHPNAVAIYDVGETAEGPFLAMELVTGSTLRSFIGDKSVSLPVRIRWLLEMARALGAAHARKLVHRDVKPENVMIRDGDGVVKVLDFGIARRTAGGSVDGPLSATLPGFIEGTPYYMAPEQFQSGEVDARADQFSWGVVAYELLSGQLPWQTSGTFAAQLAMMMAGPAPTLASLGVATPPAVSATIARALSLDEDDRFSSMDRIAATLEPYAEQHSDQGLSLRATLPANTRTEAVSSAPPPPGEDLITQMSAAARARQPEPPRRSELSDTKRTTFAPPARNEQLPTRPETSPAKGADSGPPRPRESGRALETRAGAPPSNKTAWLIAFGVSLLIIAALVTRLVVQ